MSKEKLTRDEYVKQWNKDNPERRAAIRKKYWDANKEVLRLKQLAKRYGISIEEYQKLKEDQNNLCAICNNPAVGRTELDVDHCHDSGKIRGLLCTGCNRGIGYLKDDPKILQSALAYLNKYKENNEQ